jgi:hypothetical protein
MIHAIIATELEEEPTGAMGAWTLREETALAERESTEDVHKGEDRGGSVL